MRASPHRASTTEHAPQGCPTSRHRAVPRVGSCGVGSELGLEEHPEVMHHLKVKHTPAMMILSSKNTLRLA